MITAAPPFGLNLFVMSGRSRVPITAITAIAFCAWPLVVSCRFPLPLLSLARVMLGAAALLRFVPALSTFMLKN